MTASTARTDHFKRGIRRSLKSVLPSYHQHRRQQPPPPSPGSSLTIPFRGPDTHHLRVLPSYTCYLDSNRHKDATNDVMLSFRRVFSCPESRVPHTILMTLPRRSPVKPGSWANFRRCSGFVGSGGFLPIFPPTCPQSFSSLSFADTIPLAPASKYHSKDAEISAQPQQRIAPQLSHARLNAPAIRVPSIVRSFQPPSILDQDLIPLVRDLRRLREAHRGMEMGGKC
ncbi:hypothetical protein C8R44DRAFT_974121, partial [Mycena epipterygia]